MKQSILEKFCETVEREKFNMYGVKVETGDGDAAIKLWRTNDRLCMYSASKTFTSIAMGIAMNEGLIRMEDHILDYFPEYADMASSGTEKITLRHVIKMVTGKNERFFPGHEPQTTPGMPRPEVSDAWNTPRDWAGVYFGIPVTTEPGEYFQYSNLNPYMCGRVIEKVSGATLRDYLKPRLFDPLKIYNPQWFTSPEGHTIGWSKLFLNTDEFSRLGHVLLHEGEYNGRRLVSADYIRKMHTDVNSSESAAKLGDNRHSLMGYGYFVWLCDYKDAYRADGRYGKFCIVIPSKDCVVTVTAHQEERTGDLLDAVFSDIVEQL